MANRRPTTRGGRFYGRDQLSDIIVFVIFKRALHGWLLPPLFERNLPNFLPRYNEIAAIRWDSRFNCFVHCALCQVDWFSYLEILCENSSRGLLPNRNLIVWCKWIKTVFNYFIGVFANLTLFWHIVTFTGASSYLRECYYSMWISFR